MATSFGSGPPVRTSMVTRSSTSRTATPTGASPYFAALSSRCTSILNSEPSAASTSGAPSTTTSSGAPLPTWSHTASIVGATAVGSGWPVGSAVVYPAATSMSSRRCSACAASRHSAGAICSRISCSLAAVSASARPRKVVIGVRSA